VWGRRVRAYLRHLDKVFSPDLFIVGGGISRKFSRFAKYLEVDCEFVAAELRNEAGIVGAAMAAAAL
jgi:polyphosphate glucokinase